MLFDTGKTSASYKQSPLFLGDYLGLHDTIHQPYPVFENLYQRMVKANWVEWEVPMTPAIVSEYASLPEDAQFLMFATLAWQWEADTLASRSILSGFSPFITNSELLRVWALITSNEFTHAATYSHVVKSMFNDSEGALEKIVKIKENFARMDKVMSVMQTLSKEGCKYALGVVRNDQSLYNTVILGVAALFLMERIQFMASFAITNVICANGLLQPVKLLVQKIAQDELNIHVQVDKAVIAIEKGTERGSIAFAQLSNEIEQLFAEVVQAELQNARFLFNNGGRNIAGLSLPKLERWIMFCAKDAYTILGLTSTWSFPDENPMPDMNLFTNVGSIDSAPQEIPPPVYLLNSIQPGNPDRKFALV